MEDLDYTRAVLLGSLMTFQRTFFKLRKGVDFELSHPLGRECRHLVMCRALKRVFTGECKRLIINIPPRYGKSEWAIAFVAWATANYPDSNHIYVSYAQSVATRQTQVIRDIMTNPLYRELFGVELDSSSAAKHNFRTTAGGEIFAAGAGGPITSRGAGIQGAKRYGGCILIDDIHKPTDVYSDTIRQGTNDWYFNTLYSRLNDPISTPIIAIGQCLHEDDLLENLKKQLKPDGTPEWEVVCLPALDIHSNALDPSKHTVEMLLEMKKRDVYTFSSQMQQQPLPPGGGIFDKADFRVLDMEPKIISTFITADTAATTKDYSDYTVFSFWGVYKIEHRGIDTGLFGLHWIDCRDLKCEPKDLEDEFFDFYATCMRHSVKPQTAAIERASTGVTLCSILKGTPGLRIIDIVRTKEGGSKTARFLECQPFVASNQVSFTAGARHMEKCINHMGKITANNSHMHDDIADTLQSAIQVTLIEGTLLPRENQNREGILKAFSNQTNHIASLRR
jgi:predicted phage terminase large subunit-like protein